MVMSGREKSGDRIVYISQYEMQNHNAAMIRHSESLVKRQGLNS